MWGVEHLGLWIPRSNVRQNAAQMGPNPRYWGIGPKSEVSNVRAIDGRLYILKLCLWCEKWGAVFESGLALQHSLEQLCSPIIVYPTSRLRLLRWCSAHITTVQRNSTRTVSLSSAILRLLIHTIVDHYLAIERNVFALVTLSSSSSPFRASSHWCLLPWLACPLARGPRDSATVSAIRRDVSERAVRLLRDLDSSLRVQWYLGYKDRNSLLYPIQSHMRRWNVLRSLWYVPFLSFRCVHVPLSVCHPRPQCQHYHWRLHRQVHVCRPSPNKRRIQLQARSQQIRWSCWAVRLHFHPNTQLSHTPRGSMLHSSNPFCSSVSHSFLLSSILRLLRP